MITYFHNATPEEQLNLWYNGNEDEVVLAKYISGVIDGISEESYDRGYEDGYSAYKEQEEQLVILEEIRQYINEQEGYNYEYC